MTVYDRIVTVDLDPDPAPDPDGWSFTYDYDYVLQVYFTSPAGRQIRMWEDNERWDVVVDDNGLEQDNVADYVPDWDDVADWANHVYSALGRATYELIHSVVDSFRDVLDEVVR